MRHLILHRQRALIGFALKYYCVLGGDRAGFLARLDQERAAAQAGESVHPSLRNGDTIVLDLPEEGGSFFVAVFLEDRSIVTDPILVEPGREDVAYGILTDRIPYKGMVIAVARAKPQP